MSITTPRAPASRAALTRSARSGRGHGHGPSVASEASSTTTAATSAGVRWGSVRTIASRSGRSMPRSASVAVVTTTRSAAVAAAAGQPVLMPFIVSV